MECLTGNLVTVWVSFAHNCIWCMQHFSEGFIIQCLSNPSPALIKNVYFGKGTCSIIKSCKRQIFMIRKRRKSNAKVKSPPPAPVPGPLNLRSTNVSTDSFQVIWDHSANDIALYRLSWAPFTGADTKEVSTTKKITPVPVKMLLTTGNMATRISIKKQYV